MIYIAEIRIDEGEPLEKALKRFKRMVEKEGIIPAIIIMVLPLIFLYLLGKVFPFWLDDSADKTTG